MKKSSRILSILLMLALLVPGFYFPAKEDITYAQSMSQYAKYETIDAKEVLPANAVIVKDKAYNIVYLNNNADAQLYLIENYNKKEPIYIKLSENLIVDIKGVIIEDKAVLPRFIQYYDSEGKVSEKAPFEITPDEVVVDMIKALPNVENVTLKDKEAVQAARIAYEALTKDQKSLVTNYDKLVALEAKIVELKEVDKTALNEKILEVESLVETDYTAISWANLQSALIEANEVAAKEDVTQEEVNDALANLTKAIENLVQTTYSFVANTNKKEYILDEEIIVTGQVLKNEEGLADIDVTLKLTKVEDSSLITIDQLKTDEQGNINYQFFLPEEIEAGAYTLTLKANDPVKKLVELPLKIINEEQEMVNVSFNYTEYTVEPKGYIPESGDLLVTTTGLKDDEIESVTIKSSNTSIVTVTQRPDYPEKGFTKIKTRAFGKAIAPGNASIIATVKAKDGNEYTAECKVNVKAKEKKIELTLKYYDSYCGFIGFTVKPTSIPENAYYFKVVIGDKESGIALIDSLDGAIFNGITVEEVQEAGEAIVQLFYDELGENKVGEVKVVPVLED